ncbi:endonuclease/exonuclease/phosphatase family protein [Dermatobacter hominis]|uniref:endonuclease/exonuclease/phosphatase family protein n=1 Tax=Dermatobacter hominis TaxID=2884263 RepID=UPI001D12760C|nr:endonuclease/exonuclease/phosphatase family protein [Dermatobacter hominis]UDY34674.1 endonuclease/exonuclease/phosphatase family protein [Dermatobacter hominis]
MRVATFNVRHGQPPRSRRADHARLLDAVRTLDADVVALQELDRRTRRVGGVDQPLLIAEATGLEVTFARAIDHDGGEYGVALATRSAPEWSEVLPLPGSGEPRVALMALVDDADVPADAVGADREGGRRRARPWAVACTHLATATDVAVGQLRMVLAAVDELAGDRPAVVLGDLNLGPDRVGPVLSATGWVAAPSGPTHPTTRPDRRIDWVLVRRATVRSAHVVDVRASDHLPLVAVLDAADHPAPVDGGGSAP